MLDSVIFRNQTEAPTEPGWYYARTDSDYPIGCHKVWKSASGMLYVDVDGSSLLMPTKILQDWYGPVTPCREG